MRETRKDLQKVCKLYQVKNGEKVTLQDCPVGLFVWNGILAMKTDYATMATGGLRNDCYLVESGEFFHGDARDSKEFNSLMVTPIIVGYGLEAKKEKEVPSVSVEAAVEIIDKADCIIGIKDTVAEEWPEVSTPEE